MTATRFGFTQKRLENLPVPTTGRIMYRDTKAPGLALQVSPTGRISAYLSKKVSGRHVKYRLGTWPTDFGGTVKGLRDAAQAALTDLDENLVGQP